MCLCVCGWVHDLLQLPPCCTLSIERVPQKLRTEKENKRNNKDQIDIVRHRKNNARENGGDEHHSHDSNAVCLMGVVVVGWGGSRHASKQAWVCGCD